jgi:hypothetical protein
MIRGSGLGSLNHVPGDAINPPRLSRDTMVVGQWCGLLPQRQFVELRRFNGLRVARFVPDPWRDVLDQQHI